MRNAMTNFLALPLFIGLRYTASRRRNQLVSFISLISMMGIILGVALLLIVLSVMNGFDRELRERILGVMPQATIYHRQGIAEWQQYQRQFVEHPKVLAAAPFVQLQGLMAFGEQVVPVNTFGILPSEETGVSRLGEFIESAQLDDLSQHSNAVLLGVGVAKRLGVAVGDQVTLVVPDKEDASRMPTLGVFSVIGTLHTGTEVDNGLCVTDLESASLLSEFPGRVSGLRLKVDDLFNAQQVVRDFMQDLPYGFYGTDWTRTHGNLFQAVQMSRQLVGLLLFLIIAIAAFNVVSTLVMVVVDKQSQIAILRSQGASQRTIMQIFVVQGAMIGIVGTLIGLVLGVAGAHFVTDFVTWLESVFQVKFLSADVYPVSYLPSDFRWSDCLNVGLTSLAMSLLATLYPAWRASRLNPADALRYDH